MMLKKPAIAFMLLTGLFAVLTPTALASCPEGCVQRSSYCDCPSGDANISTSCSEEFQCDYGFVCDPQTLTCRLAGGEERVAAPEGDFAIVALIFAMASLLFLLRK